MGPKEAAKEAAIAEALLWLALLALVAEAQAVAVDEQAKGEAWPQCLIN